MPIEIMAARVLIPCASAPCARWVWWTPTPATAPGPMSSSAPRIRNAPSIISWASRPNLKWGEQKRVFSMIPGLENAEFVRYGVMHRNTFLDAPRVLDAGLFLKEHPNVFFAGQITALRAIWRAPPAACWQPGASTPDWRQAAAPAAGGYHVRRADPVSDH